MPTVAYFVLTRNGSNYGAWHICWKGTYEWETKAVAVAEKVNNDDQHSKSTIGGEPVDEITRSRITTLLLSFNCCCVVDLGQP